MRKSEATRKAAVTAYHEAGHAFADFRFGFKIKEVSIIPNDTSTGRAVSKTRLHFRSLEYSAPTGRRIGRLHELVVSLLAGEAAQRHFQPRSIRFHQARYDREAIYEVLSRLHAENELPHVIRYLDAKAKNLIEDPRHWPVIEHLASELINRKILTGEDAEAAIREGYRRYHLRSVGRDIQGGTLLVSQSTQATDT